MIKCSKCKNVMIPADLYDPEGLIPLYDGKMKDGHLWVCIGCSREQKRIEKQERKIDA